MIAPKVQILLTAFLISATSAIPGVFLVLRKMSLISDAISHSALLGVVIGLLVGGSQSSPALILGAVISGFAMTTMVEILIGTKKMSKDSAIGVVFPLFFSIAMIIINRRMGSVYFDFDTILFGDLAFVPFNRMVIGGMDLGPSALWSIGTVGVANILFVAAFYKELLVSTFDPEFASVIGVARKKIHYMLMILTSATVVVAFESVGTILVVGLIVVVPSTAYLLANSVRMMMVISVAISLVSSIAGYLLAHIADGSIAGAIITVDGLIFFSILAWQRWRISCSRNEIASIRV